MRYAGLPFHCNAQLDQPGIERFCGLDATASKLLRQAVERFRLSMRAYAAFARWRARWQTWRAMMPYRSGMLRWPFNFEPQTDHMGGRACI